jgi:hypothetical protein
MYAFIQLSVQFDNYDSRAAVGCIRTATATTAACVCSAGLISFIDLKSALAAATVAAQASVGSLIKRRSAAAASVSYGRARN